MTSIDYWQPEVGGPGLCSGGFQVELGGTGLDRGGSGVGGGQGWGSEDWPGKEYLRFYKSQCKSRDKYYLLFEERHSRYLLYRGTGPGGLEHICRWGGKDGGAVHDLPRPGLLLLVS